MSGRQFFFEQLAALGDGSWLADARLPAQQLAHACRKGLASRLPVGLSLNSAPSRTESASAVRDELVAAIDTQLARLESVLGPELDTFNKQIADLQLPAIAEQK